MIKPTKKEIELIIEGLPSVNSWAHDCINVEYGDRTLPTVSEGNRNPPSLEDMLVNQLRFEKQRDSLGVVEWVYVET